MRSISGLVCTIVMFAPAVALAQSTTDPDPNARPPQSSAAPTPAGQLPPAQAAADPEPTVPAPTIPAITGDVVEPPGVDDRVGYARAGVREVGGAAGLTIAQDIRAVNFSPSVGWFLTDNFELSGILDVTNLKAGEADATMWSALVEPSFHVPFNPSLFGFVGMGVGAAYVSELGSGLAVAPRVGLDVLVGRSGILRPSLQYEYTTHDAMGTVDENGNTDVTLVAISSALRFNIGYSRMW